MLLIKSDTGIDLRQTMVSIDIMCSGIRSQVTARMSFFAVYKGVYCNIRM